LGERSLLFELALSLGSVPLSSAQPADLGLFVPLAIIFAIIALVKKQFAWGIAALIIAIISAWMSPSIWALLAGIGLVSSM
jgi:hypothetical protein